MLVRYLKKLSPSRSVNLLNEIIGNCVKEESPEKALQFLFDLDNRLYFLEGKLAVLYGKGIHTKHKHINYHQFFIKNINNDEHILDIGSGNGLLCYKMVTEVPGAKVTGIELNVDNFKFACAHYKHPNLNFINKDATTDLPDGKFDVVTMSNILEHIENRVKFLDNIRKKLKPKHLIIRVPFFERDWRVPLKKELGIDYRLDSTHFIEYTEKEFLYELEQANLFPINIEYRWGEIWSVVQPINKEYTNI
jgi:2-polyprenyl-3-methyl-5-hydroxy-6-metoxy-1,4-benzoquinol methylase